mgnify:CR=1 FL=1
MADLRVLVVDDETNITDLVATALRYEGFAVEAANGGNDALRATESFRPDLILLDVMMPDRDGFQVAERLRNDGYEVPIIFLTARAEVRDVVRGLEMGADDYVLKPFSPRELVARIKVIFRRVASGGQRVTAPDGATYAFAGWLLKSQERTLVDSEGVSLPLSTAEYNLMLAFATRPNQVLSRDQLLDITQGREANAFDRAIDNQISRLRKKIEVDPSNPRFLRTVRGEGYIFSLTDLGPRS